MGCRKRGLRRSRSEAVACRVFLQIGVHSMGTIFQQHRRLASSGNCAVGTRRPFSWLSGHEGVLAAVGASLESRRACRGARCGRSTRRPCSCRRARVPSRRTRCSWCRDHAPGLVGIRYDLEQEPGTLLVDRHVAELVDDQEPRLGDLPELRVEPVLALRAAQPGLATVRWAVS